MVFELVSGLMPKNVIDAVQADLNNSYGPGPRKFSLPSCSHPDLGTGRSVLFEGGRVSRQDLISWILAKFADECSDQEIRAIRADHFDEIMLLEISLKKFKQAGGLPPELKKLLLAQAGIDEVPKAKRAKAS